MNPLIEVSNLLVIRGKRIALELDSLDVAEGEVLAVVGPNGAGKSTLLLTLARLLDLERGHILFNGSPADRVSATAYRRHIALVMQEPLLFDTTVFENVAMGLRFRGASREDIARKVSHWLENTGVSHLAERRASELSGGEAQRVSLARAMVLEPELLLLDEPFSALDPPTRGRLLDDLNSLLYQTATTTVFVTHDLGEATQLADRIAVVIGHRLRQIAKVKDLFNSPADRDVSAFLNHQPQPREVGMKVR
jgi:tungstate transport system ATP-binding protein